MKTVFITGGNRGIGLQTALDMGKLGYRVIIGCRREDQAKEALQKLTDAGVKADYTLIDVVDEASVAKAAKDVGVKCNGVLDVLINNAGYLPPSLEGDIVDLSELRKTLDINLIGLVSVTNSFLDLVKKAQAGRIVFVSSIMGSMGAKLCQIKTAAYNMSKVAVNMYCMNLADALKSTNIKVNSCHPGWVKTDMGGDDADLGVEEGAKTSVFLATLPDEGPTGGFFFKEERLEW